MSEKLQSSEATLSAHQVRLETLEQSDEKQWTAIDHIKERLPVWATVVFGILTFMLGFMSNFKIKP